MEPEESIEIAEETYDGGAFIAHPHCDGPECSNITMGILNPTMVEGVRDGEESGDLIPTVSMDSLTALSIARGILELVEQQVRKTLDHEEESGEVHGAD